MWRSIRPWNVQTDRYITFLSSCCNCDYSSICDILCDNTADKWVTLKQMAWCIQSVSMLLALRWAPLFSPITWADHNPSSEMRVSHVFMNDRMLTVRVVKGEDRRADQLREWVVWLCSWGGKSQRMQRGNVGKARGGGEKPPRKWTRSEREVWEI